MTMLGDPLTRWSFGPGDCWLWNAGKNGRGYGAFRMGERMVYAHRYIYETVVEPIGDLTIDHLCMVRSCVNPDHLEPVTLSENISRGRRATTLRRAQAKEATQ